MLVGTVSLSRTERWSKSTLSAKSPTIYRPNNNINFLSTVYWIVAKLISKTSILDASDPHIWIIDCIFTTFHHREKTRFTENAHTQLVTHVQHLKSTCVNDSDSRICIPRIIFVHHIDGHTMVNSISLYRWSLRIDFLCFPGLTGRTIELLCTGLHVQFSKKTLRRAIRYASSSDCQRKKYVDCTGCVQKMKSNVRG